jgi:hypothetical protein
MKTTRTSRTEVRLSEIADTLNVLATDTRTRLETMPVPDNASELSEHLAKAEALVKAIRNANQLDLNATVGELVIEHREER